MPPRRKPIYRRPLLVAPLPDHQQDDVDFFNLVDYLLTTSAGLQSPSSHSEDDVQRPAKRARTASSETRYPYIVVGRRQITASRPVGGRNLPSFLSIPRRNVNRDFALRFRVFDGITITPRAKKALGSTKKVVLRLQDLGAMDDYESAVLLLSVAESTSHIPAGPGCFWTAMDFAVRRTEADEVVLSIYLELRWNESTVVDWRTHTASQSELRRRVLRLFFPETLESPNLCGTEESGSPQDFYEAAHVPENDGLDAENPLCVPDLTANLFPFQRRAVRWLLQREGAQWTPSADGGAVIPYSAALKPESLAHFVPASDADGQPFFISDLFGLVTRNPSAFGEDEREAVRGGILSEEMGLGKTVEMISLILLHRRSLPTTTDLPEGLLEADGAQDCESGFIGPLRPTGATLIVTPAVLQSQWLSEINRHAPSLSVMVYQGMARSCPDEASEAAMVERLAGHDVVITTYSHLRSELYFALDPPERSLRHARREPRRRSPLVQLNWWRVCLDEAQEVESGVSSAATVVRVIPRVNAWGVTGTPVKNNIQDLWGLLVFLRYEPYASITNIWQQLTRSHKALFRNLFGRIAMRHTKRVVGDELVIPPQKRFVITMPFTAVEEQHYQSLFKQLVELCGLNPQGAPLRPDWDPESPGVVEAMRSALNRLRQTALHPEIGQQNRRALGVRAGPMRTLQEVLDAMIEQSESSLRVDRRALLTHRLKHGQMLENSPRVREALEIWKEALKDSEALVQSSRAKLKEEVDRAKEKNRDGEDDGRGTEQANRSKRTRALLAGGEATEGESEGESEDEDGDGYFLDENGEVKVGHGRVGDAQRELRYALEIQHRAQFFCANAYYQIKSNENMTPPGSEAFHQIEALETEAYERAKRVRQEILHDNLSRATRQMAELEDKAASQSFVVIPECVFETPQGIEGRRIAQELDELSEMLNRQADQLDTWREAVVQLVLKDLVDEEGDEEGSDEDHDAPDDNTNDGTENGMADNIKLGEKNEITGDEYENSTRVQEEIQAYLTIIRAAVSDRQMALTGVAPSGLAKYEELTAFRMAKEGEGPAPELMMRLFKERMAVKFPPEPESDDGGGKSGTAKKKAPDAQSQVSLRAALVQLRDLFMTLRGQVNMTGSSRAQAEMKCVQQQLKRAQDQQGQQVRATMALEKEANKIKNALNSRIAYYRQLQVVSDMVGLYEGANDDAAVLGAAAEEVNMARSLEAAESKHRYLVHLKESDSNEESRLCIICQTTFNVGVLTVCGHRFCKECITLWFQAHHNCPICKRRLHTANLHNIVLKPQEFKVVSEDYHGGNNSSSGQSGNSQPAGQQEEDGNEAANSQQSKKTSIYANFSADQLYVDLPGPSFTTKVDTLVRHLLWLRSADPGTKSIVFSQFPDFLGILARAFRHHHIGFSRYTDRNGIESFREDPRVECFLLHARAHASGLNLVNANHVILCEPLINTALELQAIARVHRIGQEQETTVWLYIVDGTVEESIYNLSVQRRMEHMGRASKGKGKEKMLAPGFSEASTPELLDSSLELANSLELQEAQLSKLMSKGKMAGEEVAQNDLWTCLFGNIARRNVGGGEAVPGQDERLRNDPLVRRHLLASAAEERQDAAT